MPWRLTRKGSWGILHKGSEAPRARWKSPDLSAPGIAEAFCRQFGGPPAHMAALPARRDTAGLANSFNSPSHVPAVPERSACKVCLPSALGTISPEPAMVSIPLFFLDPYSADIFATCRSGPDLRDVQSAAKVVKHTCSIVQRHITPAGLETGDRNLQPANCHFVILKDAFGFRQQKP